MNLAVYDVLGRRVATLVAREQESGAHDAECEAEGLPSGAYFYKLEAEGQVLSGSMIVQR